MANLIQLKQNNILNFVEIVNLNFVKRNFSLIVNM